MMPTEKMKAVGIGGVIAMLIMGALDQVFPGVIDWTADVAGTGIPMGTLFVFAVSWAAGWFKPERKAAGVQCAPVAMACALLLVLAACAGTTETRSTTTLAIACDTYATALGQLTPLRAAGKLSDEQVSRVDATNAVVDRACSSGSDLDPAAAVGRVRDGISILESIR